MSQLEIYIKNKNSFL